MSALFFHPLTTFFLGLIVAVLGVGLLLSSCAPVNRSSEDVSTYQQVLAKTNVPFEGDDEAAIKSFTTFLQSIGSEQKIRENTRKVYAADAYLNDTLVTKRGVDEIEAYFLETNKAIKSYKVTIDDVSRSGADHYIRWTMVFAASALSGGEPVHSTGISQVRFNSEGKVTVHQDYWDSGKNFFGHLPVAGNAIQFIRGRLD